VTGPANRSHAPSDVQAGPGGEVALLDWEDVSAVPGVLDLAWLLVSSVEPAQWDEVIAAYGPAGGLAEALPAVAVQALLSMSDTAAGSAAASGWARRFAAAAARIRRASDRL
jgi:aminoglycoside phosphotransferase (APT) family kinase protein